MDWRRRHLATAAGSFGVIASSAAAAAAAARLPGRQEAVALPVGWCVRRCPGRCLVRRQQRVCWVLPLSHMHPQLSPS